MKLHLLIAKLAEIQANHGPDVGVEVWNNNRAGGFPVSIESVDYVVKLRDHESKGPLVLIS